jgi:hypothetical protein
MLSSLLIVNHFHWSPTLTNLPHTKICRNIILSYLYGFPCGFHTKVVYVFLASPVLTTCLADREFTVLTVGSHQSKPFIERWTEYEERIVADTCKASVGKPERTSPFRVAVYWRMIVNCILQKLMKFWIRLLWWLGAQLSGELSCVR